MSELYFAYASNLWIDQMVARTGRADVRAGGSAIARLPHHRLAFNVRWDDGNVYASLVQPGDGVIGVLYRCGPDSLDGLDVYEAGYERRIVRVVAEDGATVDAVAYVAEPAFVVDERRPSAEYVLRIVTGARQHGLPEEYIRQIEALAAGAGS